jgi:metallo-beta-lactamase class B
MLLRMLSHLLVIPVFFAGLIASASQIPAEWTEPFPPHRIIGSVYYVGNRDLAAFLITPPQGHILINSNLESSVPQIKKKRGTARLPLH